jgi:hypothetical protein
MLKLMGKGTRADGKPVTLVVLGLSHANLDRLREGRPIKFSGETCGLGDDIVFTIFAGENEQSMGREVADMIGPDTKVSIDPRLKD